MRFHSCCVHLFTFKCPSICIDSWTNYLWLLKNWSVHTHCFDWRPLLLYFCSLIHILSFCFLLQWCLIIVASLLYFLQLIQRHQRISCCLLCALLFWFLGILLCFSNHFTVEREKVRSKHTSLSDTALYFFFFFFFLMSWFTHQLTLLMSHIISCFIFNWSCPWTSHRLAEGKIPSFLFLRVGSELPPNMSCFFTSNLSKYYKLS